MGMAVDNHIEILKSYHNGFTGYVANLQDSIDVAVDIMCKYQQLEDFARWVAVEVIDEELWTYNHLSFAELACRKLVQLGIMQESDGEYTYEVVEDENDQRDIQE